MKMLVLIFSVALVLPSQQRTVIGDVVNTERLFSAAAVSRGVKEAFVSFLDTGCVIFRPVPVNGYRWYQDRPPAKGFLSWIPEKVELSSSGDLAYSTGPWEYRKANMEEAPAAYGHYFSVWKKNSTGEWKVVLDDGNSYQKPEKGKYVLDTITLSSPSDPGHAFPSRGGMAETENLFHQDIAESGFSRSLKKYAANDLRLYRSGTFPAEGITRSMETAKHDTARYTFQRFGSDSSSSGDLGYSYGLQISSRHDTGTFVHVWRRTKLWELVIDIRSGIHK
ncbi:MAG: hypothetical protein WCT99_01560 [Bacteroidota bacterium]|jgi:hypothetical protein